MGSDHSFLPPWEVTTHSSPMGSRHSFLYHHSLIPFLAPWTFALKNTVLGASFRVPRTVKGGWDGKPNWPSWRHCLRPQAFAPLFGGAGRAVSAHPRCRRTLLDLLCGIAGPFPNRVWYSDRGVPGLESPVPFLGNNGGCTRRTTGLSSSAVNTPTPGPTHSHPTASATHQWATEEAGRESGRGPPPWSEDLEHTQWERWDAVAHDAPTRPFFPNQVTTAISQGRNYSGNLLVQLGCSQRASPLTSSHWREHGPPRTPARTPCPSYGCEQSRIRNVPIIQNFLFRPSSWLNQQGLVQAGTS